MDIRDHSQRSRYVVPTISDKRGWLLVLNVWGWPALQCTWKLDRLRKQCSHSECSTCSCIIDFPLPAIQDGTVESAFPSFANSTYPSILPLRCHHIIGFNMSLHSALHPNIRYVCIQNEKRGDLKACSENVGGLIVEQKYAKVSENMRSLIGMGDFVHCDWLKKFQRAIELYAIDFYSIYMVKCACSWNIHSVGGLVCWFTTELNRASSYRATSSFVAAINSSSPLPSELLCNTLRRCVGLLSWMFARSFISFWAARVPCLV